MASLNALRGLLVAGAAVAAVVAAVTGMWAVSALMLVAVAVHGVGTVWLRRRAVGTSLPPAGAAPDPADSH